MIDETGKNLGVLETWKALQLAMEKNMELIEIVPSISPPVCKIMDYGKFIYREEKKERAQKAKQKGGEVKGIRFGVNTSPHDLETKTNQIEKFLKEDNKVKIDLFLRGREKALRDFAQQKFNQFLDIIKQRIEFKIEQEPKKTPWGLTILISRK